MEKASTLPPRTYLIWRTLKTNINKIAANIFTTNLRLVKVGAKTWMKAYELTPLFTLAIWACGVVVKIDSFSLFLERIKNLYKKMGPKGLFYYLKECQRRVIYFLADQLVVSGGNTPYIKTDSHGLPTIIPWLLRQEILLFKANGLRGNKSIVVCILTLLSIFRIFKNKVRPNLSSILKPFSGTTTSFDVRLLKRAIKSLNLGMLTIRKPKLLLIEKASPNAVKSTWGASLDAVAFAFYPRVLWNYVVFNVSHVSNGIWWTAWVLLIILFSAPFIVLLYLVGNPIKLCIARLSVVYDQAGKARIVGITNYWLQVCLEPLHTAILALLEKIPQDGTFNQILPIKLLVDTVEPGQVFYSFDLSSATDRLPIVIQMQILNILVPGMGTSWMNLLGSLRWQWKSLNERVPLKEIQYAVGQPMGAYSSWAMLALTHHIIVQCAALNVGKPNFRAYAVLGDDIVIADDLVASEYLRLMNMLGVDINLAKSLQSKDFCEFAKRWIGPNGLDLSPIGPGLLLRTVRNRFFLASLLSSMWDIGLIQNLQATLTSVSSLPDQYRGQR